MAKELLVLASQSASRRAMLDAVGEPYEAIPAHVDERAIEAALGDALPAHIALALAEAKALEVSARSPGRLVLGSDSLVVVGGQRYDKPESREDAARHLRGFSGQVMALHSAAALARDGAIVWRHDDAAKLHVHDLDDAFIAAYLDAEWPHVAGCVGVFRIEARGPRLFRSIAGDYFTILGMPLLAVLSALRDMEHV